jgi:hypothetical protein
MPICRVAWSLTGALLIVSAAVAQEQVAPLSLPQLEKCDGASRPRLPEKWRGSYLMAPFTNSQLVLAEIVSDQPLSAMRVKLYGVRRGSADLLVLGTNTYLLESDGAAIQCRSLGDTGWRPLPQDWLTASSQCAGSGPIGTTAVDWWKTAIVPKPASYWVWYKTADRSPFRLVFPFASDRLSVLSRYALSYQVSFTPLAQSELADIAAVCRRARPALRGTGTRALNAVIDAIGQAEHRAADDIARLMPALEASCSDIAFPQWPEQLAVAGVLTPIDADEDPYPVEVRYDWTVPAQRTRIFGQADSEFSMQDSLLLGPQGYVVTYRRRHALTCRAILPGTIRPDWPVRAPCDCAAAINGTTPLSPDGTTRIMSCPLASPRAAWAWYALTGRPTVFMVTSRRGDEGSGLFAVLDYRDWLPGHASPSSVFEKPAQCIAPKQAHSSRAASRNEALRCFTCHLGGAATR